MHPCAQIGIPTDRHTLVPRRDMSTRHCACLPADNSIKLYNQTTLQGRRMPNMAAELVCSAEKQGWLDPPDLIKGLQRDRPETMPQPSNAIGEFSKQERISLEHFGHLADGRGAQQRCQHDTHQRQHTSDFLHELRNTLATSATRPISRQQESLSNHDCSN